MKVTLRKIAVLALILVLICMFSASAFAATSYLDTEDYNGEAVVEASASISQTSTSGSVSLMTPDAVGNYIHIEVRCSFYWGSMSFVMTDSYAEDYYDVRSGTLRYDTETYKEHKGITSNYAIVEMDTATYTFNASFNLSSGTQEYICTSDRLVY